MDKKTAVKVVKKAFPVPDYSMSNIEISVKILQTGKKQRNMLSLSCSIVHVMAIRSKNELCKSQCDETVSMSAHSILRATCIKMYFLYDKLDVDAI